jgi:DNA-binding cell septation regulator SpoVG
MVKITNLKLIDESRRRTRLECEIEVLGFHIKGMRLVERANGEFIVSFPFYKDSDGETHEYLYPTDDAVKEQILDVLLEMYRNASGRTDIPVKDKPEEEEPEIEEPHPVEKLDMTLRDINTRLKQSTSERQEEKKPRPIQLDDDGFGEERRIVRPKRRRTQSTFRKEKAHA